MRFFALTVFAFSLFVPSSSFAILSALQWETAECKQVVTVTPVTYSAPVQKGPYTYSVGTTETEYDLPSGTYTGFTPVNMYAPLVHVFQSGVVRLYGWYNNAWDYKLAVAYPTYMNFIPESTPGIPIAELPPVCIPDPPCPDAGTEAGWIQNEGLHSRPNLVCDELTDCYIAPITNIPNVSVSWREDGVWYTGWAGAYTGEHCETGSSPVVPPAEDCPSFLARCEELCRGAIETESFCNAQSRSCKCDLAPPPYPLVDDDQSAIPEPQPDQDEDGVGSGEDPDVDGDGTGNGDDSDVDGDGTDNGHDNDTDGDGTGNGGDNGSWNPDRGSEAGRGRDGDVDGDGLGNGDDPDVDGDGQPNGDDPDIDGDGIPNHLDEDADGDGIPNGSDADADGDGVPNGDDIDPDGGGSSTGDTDGDGENEGTGEGTDEGEEGGNGTDPIAAGACPAGRVCAGDGVCQAGEDATSADCVGDDYTSTRFNQMMDSVKGTGLFSLTEGLSSLPSGGQSSLSVNLGNWGGVQSFDFADLSYAWAILNAVFTTCFAFLGIRIIILKR